MERNSIIAAVERWHPTMLERTSNFIGGGIALRSPQRLEVDLAQREIDKKDKKIWHHSWQCILNTKNKKNLYTQYVNLAIYAVSLTIVVLCLGRYMLYNVLLIVFITISCSFVCSFICRFLKPNTPRKIR